MPSPLGRRALAWVAGVGLLLLFGSLGLDQPIRDWVLNWGECALASIWAQAAYYAGLGGVQIGGMLFLGLAAWWLKRRKAFHACLWAAASVLISGALTQVIKHLLGRPRPRMNLPALQLAGPTWEADFHSFPSGHAATSFALAAVLAARYPSAAWVFYLLAALVAAGRVLGGSHYLSDVLGGAILGLLVGMPLAETARRWKTKLA